MPVCRTSENTETIPNKLHGGTFLVGAPLGSTNLRLGRHRVTFCAVCNDGTSYVPAYGTAMCASHNPACSVTMQNLATLPGLTQPACDANALQYLMQSDSRMDQ
jgi:hypothetical protein